MGVGIFINKTTDDTEALTMDKSLAQYEKNELKVTYDKTILNKDPLKLMYATVFYQGDLLRK